MKSHDVERQCFSAQFPEPNTKSWCPRSRKTPAGEYLSAELNRLLLPVEMGFIGSKCVLRYLIGSTERPLENYGRRMEIGRKGAVGRRSTA
jgi:hypothetical protein